MGIIYVDTDSWHDSGRGYNLYGALEEKELAEWLNKAPNYPHIHPAISVNKITVGAFFNSGCHIYVIYANLYFQSTYGGRRSFHTALMRMERDAMEIGATSLRDLLELRV